VCVCVRKSDRICLFVCEKESVCVFVCKQEIERGRELVNLRKRVKDVEGEREIG
jgi:hypothetical protein